MKKYSPRVHKAPGKNKTIPKLMSRKVKVKKSADVKPYGGQGKKYF